MNRTKKWRDKNHDEWLAWSRKYRAKNKERLNAYKREYYKKNREKLLKASKKYVEKSHYFEKNREKFREYLKEYRKKNPDKVKAWKKAENERLKLKRAMRPPKKCKCGASLPNYRFNTCFECRTKALKLKYAKTNSN